MMILNYNKQMIQLKIVYYGCAMSGKTTSLKNLFKQFSIEDKLTSIETTTGRTLFFDFGVLSLQEGDWLVKISLYSATGQDFYSATRPATLTGADGIIFVIDSQKKIFNDNLNSWKELKNFYGENLSKIPIVICLNKQDLSGLIETDKIRQEFLNETLQKVCFIKTEAITGKGIIEAFKAMLELLFPTLKIT